MPNDLIEEPDRLPTAARRAFYARQSRLNDALEEGLARGEVRAAWRAADGAPGAGMVPVTARALADLPAVFWFQVAVGVATTLIGAFVWALRPRLPAAALFAATGVCVAMSSMSASVYSTRAVALPGETLRALGAGQRRRRGAVRRRAGRHPRAPSAPRGAALGAPGPWPRCSGRGSPPSGRTWCPGPSPA